MQPGWVIRINRVTFCPGQLGLTHFIKYLVLTWILHTVPLNYNFTFTRVSTRVTTRGSRGRCQNLPWKGSFPRDGPWLFHAKTRGISRHVAFPRNESWNFHETSYRGISRGIFTRPVVVALKSQWLVKAFTIRNLFTIELI